MIKWKWQNTGVIKSQNATRVKNLEWS